MKTRRLEIFFDPGAGFFDRALWNAQRRNNLSNTIFEKRV